ncbi:MAG TPA: DUF6600 domain-containing protein, partial [Thermoanaerobaculia bacterium]|nr:DUF6600 domain-containing protein [Thermoanaerobaculia bacterium]
MRSRGFRSLLPGLAALVVAAAPARAQRTGYAHVTDVDGSGSVLSDANGRTDIQLNLPLAEGDQLVTNAGGRAEIELADGNRIQVAGESRIRLDALAGEEGSDAAESAISLDEGSVAVESGTFSDSRAFRVDTPDASVYVPSQAQARINLDPHHGTAVIVRRGSVDVQTRSGPLTAEAGQYLLVQGDEQPELARGTFSRDRFDMWVAERTETTLQAYNSVSARYVDGDDYDQDVASLDDYGSWDYSPTYDTQVWRPNVGADWSPYSDGYWYWTPAGVSWVSSERWGWFPHHFGNWFFDAAFGSWCWSPAFVYSPAWVYWSYASDWVGWCPIGYYSYYAPYASYWGGYGGWHSGLYFSVSGLFDRGRVDWRRGWSFVGAQKFGSRFDRRSVLPGSSVASRLGTRVAITSDPLRVPLVSGRGSAATAIRSYARTAPAVIARQTSPDRSAALTPFLGRQATLPASTVRTLQDTQLARVNPAARRLEGPGAARLAGGSRTVASRALPSGSRSLAGGAFANPGASRSESWRSPGRSSIASSPRSGSLSGGRSISPRPAPRSEGTSSSWRDRAESPRMTSRSGAFGDGNARSFSRSAPSSGSWRERSPAVSPRGYTPPRSGRFESAPSDSWRLRANTPPAQRVIEGIDRGR